MKSRGPRGVKGMRPEALDRAREAARQSGVSIGQWINDAIHARDNDREPGAYRYPDYAADPRPRREYVEPRERIDPIADIHHRLDMISGQVERLAGATGRAPERSLAHQLDDAISRLDHHLSRISVERPAQAPVADPRYRPAGNHVRSDAPNPGAPRRHDPDNLGLAIAEISARQNELRGAVSSPPPGMAQAPAPRMAPPLGAHEAARPFDVSGIERQLHALTGQIEALRRPGLIEESIAAFRAELAEIRQSMKDAMPRRAIESLESEIRALAQRVDQGRHDGVDPAALAGIEHALADIREALRSLTPAEQLRGIDATVRGLSDKIDLIVRSAQDPGAFHQIENAINALRGMIGNVASNETIARLSDHIHALGERVDRLTRDDAAQAELFSALEQRIATLTDSLQSRAHAPAGDTRELESAVHALTARIDRLNIGQEGSETFEGLERRIAELLQRFEGDSARFAQFDLVTRELTDALRHLEQERATFAAAAAPSIASVNGDFVDVIKREINDLRFSQTETERRTRDTLEVVNDTLGHMVDRLVTLEDDLRDARAAPVQPAAPHAPAFGESPTHLSPTHLSPIATPAFPPAAFSTAPDWQQEEHHAGHGPEAEFVRNAAPFLPNPVLDERREDAPARAWDPGARAEIPLAPSMHDLGIQPTNDMPAEMPPIFAPQSSATSVPPPPDRMVDDRHFHEAPARPEDIAIGGAQTSPSHHIDLPHVPAEITPSAIPRDVPERVFTPSTPAGETPSRASAPRERPAIEPIRPIDPDLPPDTPIEPGSRFAPRTGPRAAERIAASEAALSDVGVQAPAEATTKLNFIVAARRAAQAATAASEKSTETKKPKALAGSAPSPEQTSFSAKLRTLLVAASVVVIVLGAYKVVTSLFSTPDFEPPATSNHSESAPALDGPPIAMPKQGTEGALTPPAEQHTTLSTGANAPSEPAGAREPVAAAPRSEMAPASQPALQEGVAPAAKPRNNDITGSILPPSATPAPNANSAREAAPTVPAMPVDEALAAKLPEPLGGPALRAAAMAGDPGAMFEIGQRYFEGRLISGDAEEAAKWFDRAAKKGVVMAMFRLGSFHEKGVGVKKDTEAAKRYYLDAAERGNAKAMHNLAVLYADGGARAPDYKNASQWFRKAAGHGISDSQYNLGVLYARGIGVEQNLSESYKWFSLAAAQGDSESGLKRDDVAKRLDAQSLAAAKLAAQTFVAEPQPSDAITVPSPAGGWDRVDARKTAVKNPAPGKRAKQ